MIISDLNPHSLDNVAINATVVWFIEKLKTTPNIKWISTETPQITQAVSVMAAAITAAGMQLSWSVIDGSGTLVISGITISSVLMFIWITLKNIVFQKIIYKASFGATKPQDASISSPAGGGPGTSD